MVYSNQEAVTNAYDASGALVRVSSIQDQGYTYRDYVTGIAYDASGRATSQTLGDSVIQAHTYYPWSQQGRRLSNLSAIGIQTYQSLTYSYDANGNIASIEDVVTAEKPVFTYDELNRLLVWDYYCSIGKGNPAFGKYELVRSDISRINLLAPVRPRTIYGSK